MNKSETIVKLAESLALAQAEMPAVKFNSTNPFLKNKYADLGAIIETSQPILARHGLLVTQLNTSSFELVTAELANVILLPPVPVVDNRVVTPTSPRFYVERVGVETVLMHSSGEWISSTISMTVETEKGKSAAQVGGSIITYLRRYSLAAILNMFADEDGDGNKPVGKHDWPPVQAQKEPEIKQEGAPVEFTLADAWKVRSENGTPYGELSVKDLSFRWNEEEKKLKKNELTGALKVETELKRKAAKMVMDARKSGEIAEVK